MSSYTSVAELASYIRTDPGTLLQRLQEAGAQKFDVQDPVTAADVDALSCYYRDQLGSQADEIVEDVRAEAEEARFAREAEPNASRGGGMLSWDDDVLLVPFEIVSNSYQRHVLAVLGGIESDDGIAVKIVRGSVSDAFVKALRHQGEHLRRVIALARCRMATAAGDIAAGLLADREVAVHPAFAPPRAAIRRSLI
ncbi:hypothetical protein [Cupriavidus plantarum]|uniref:hypothetical protein n=1 Tax=Cupriavidus plantarum TaxID=942865 RepID=UPI00339D7B2D